MPKDRGFAIVLSNFPEGGSSVFTFWKSSKYCTESKINDGKT